METIIFNNKNAYESFSIWIAKEYTLPFVQEDIENKVIDGRSGSLTKKLGTYKDISIKLELKLVDCENYRATIRKINKWLTEIEDNKLMFSSYKSKYLKVKKVTIENIEKDILRCGNFTVEFLCEPFYYESNETFQTLGTNTIVTNYGDLASQVNLLLENVSGNISISINGREIQFTGVEGTIDLNSELRRVIDESGQGLTNKMIGKFPIYLDVGDNLIITSGTIGSFKMDKNTIYKN